MKKTSNTVIYRHHKETIITMNLEIYQVILVLAMFLASVINKGNLLFSFVSGQETQFEFNLAASSLTAPEDFGGK